MDLTELDLILGKIVSELRTLDQIFKEIDPSEIALRRQASQKHFQLFKSQLQDDIIKAPFPMFKSTELFTTVRLEDGQNKKNLILNPNPNQKPDLPSDLYSERFLKYHHYLYVVSLEKKTEKERVVVAVRFDAQVKAYYFLEISKKGTMLRALEEAVFKFKLDFRSKFSSQNAQIKSILTTHFYPNASLYRVTNTNAIEPLSGIEVKHPQNNFKSFKCGNILLFKLFFFFAFLHFKHL